MEPVGHYTIEELEVVVQQTEFALPKVAQQSAGREHPFSKHSQPRAVSYLVFRSLDHEPFVPYKHHASPDLSGV